jgi:hypothetical protein
MNTEEEQTQLPADTKDESPAEVKEDADFGAALDRALAAFENNVVRNSVLARNTAAFNWFQSKMPVLKEMILKEIEA